MWEFVLGLIAGGLFGVLIMSLMNSSSSAERRISIYRLYIALHNLLYGCNLADNYEELSIYVKGEYLDAAENALKEYEQVYQ